jgi:hypothetical protein
MDPSIPQYMGSWHNSVFLSVRNWKFSEMNPSLFNAIQLLWVVYLLCIAYCRPPNVLYHKAVIIHRTCHGGTSN